MPAHTLSKLTPLATALLMRNAIRPKLSLTGLGMAISMILSSQVQAQEWNLNIPAQPLDQALQHLASEVNVQILYNPTDLQGLRSHSLKGNYQLDDSIKTLLQGTGVNYQLNGNNITLRAPAVVSLEPLELSSVAISGKAPGSTTEGTGSYTTYSTSSSTRLNLTPKETPQSLTVLTRQRLDDQHITNLTEALDATPGIIVKPISLGADSPQIWARGSTINNFQIDGVPTSSNLGNYIQNTAAYDRIEIVRGATGMMSGMGYPSATINMIRKRPTFEPQISLTAEAGSWDRYGTGFDISGPLSESGNVRGRLVADYKSQHAWTDNYEQEFTGLYGITEFDLNEDTLLTAGFNSVKRNTNSQTRTFPIYYSNGQHVNADATDNDSPEWAYYDHELNSVFASIEHKFASGWNLKSELTHTQYRYDSIVAALTGSINQTTGLGGTIQSPRWAASVIQNSLDTYVTGPLELFGKTHELIGGVTLSQLESDSPGYTMTTPTYSVPNIYEWAKNSPEPTYRKSGKTETNEYQYSAYLSTRLHLTDSTRLLVGGRVTDWKQNRDSTTYSTGAKSKTSSRESGVFIPYVGITQDLDDTWTAYASYTKIFNPQPYYVRDANDQSLAPEEGTSYEAGIKATFNDNRLTSGLSVFKTEQDSLPVWDAANRYYTVESGTDTEGVELEFNGELMKDWNFSSGYVYSVTRNNEDVRILTRAPRHSLKTFTTYRLPGDLDKLTIGGGANWESKTGDNLHTYTQSSYAVFNLMARYEINKNLSTTININNIFNKEYLVGIGGNIGLYGAPRGVMTSLKYTY